jgi:hypothetical protein
MKGTKETIGTTRSAMTSRPTMMNDDLSEISFRKVLTFTVLPLIEINLVNLGLHLQSLSLKPNFFSHI